MAGGLFGLGGLALTRKLLGHKKKKDPKPATPVAVAQAAATPREIANRVQQGGATSPGGQALLGVGSGGI